MAAEAARLPRPEQRPQAAQDRLGAFAPRHHRLRLGPLYDASQPESCEGKAAAGSSPAAPTPSQPTTERLQCYKKCVVVIIDSQAFNRNNVFKFTPLSMRYLVGWRNFSNYAITYHRVESVTNPLPPCPTPSLPPSLPLCQSISQIPFTSFHVSSGVGTKATLNDRKRVRSALQPS